MTSELYVYGPDCPNCGDDFYLCECGPVACTATLRTMIDQRCYDATGIIQLVESFDEPTTVDDATMIESGLRGWGESNAVVQHGETLYLATVE